MDDGKSGPGERTGIVMDLGHLAIQPRLITSTKPQRDMSSWRPLEEDFRPANSLVSLACPPKGSYSLPVFPNP